MAAKQITAEISADSGADRSADIRKILQDFRERFVHHHFTCEVQRIREGRLD